ncbi:MAG: hypothetical protein V2J25_00970 [Desulfatiglans sp.]|jgi:hypothetical protein|nr:hypothetical protein [Desulfatiglans sp.]
MKRHYLVGVVAALFILFALSFGCSTAKSWVRTIRHPEVELKKRVVVLPFIDQAGLGEAGAGQATESFITSLAESPHLLLFSAPPSMRAKKRIKSPEFGIVTHPTLVKMADDLDMNALITGVINPIEISNRKKGIWPFRSEVQVYEVSVVINVVDIINGTLILTRLVPQEVLIDRDDVESRDEKELMDEVIEESLPDILEEHASRVIETMEERVWEGKIRDVREGLIKINAGKDIGLRKDHRFDVFASNDVIQARGNTTLTLLGELIGEIKPISIMETHSLAEAVGDGRFTAGQVIRLRH